jgi:hypothetical protein
MPEDVRTCLDYFRLVAQKARSKPRAHLFEACALLHADRSASLDAHADALMRCLGEALDRMPRLLAPQEAEVSFDEAWLISLVRASSRQDRASVSFLLASRVAPPHRRLIGFLIGRISEHFAPV